LNYMQLTSASFDYQLLENLELLEYAWDCLAIEDGLFLWNDVGFSIIFLAFIFGKELCTAYYNYQPLSFLFVDFGGFDAKMINSIEFTYKCSYFSNLIMAS
jgi:hypothetical protein